MKFKCILPILALFLAQEASSNDEGNYKVGVGIADITGPVAEIMMMGYANLEQSARGLHIRLFSRAFVFQSEDEPPVVFVSGDIQSVDQAVKFKVVERLQEKYGPDLFTEKNVLLSGTHTHSGPAAFMQYLLYGITSLGFNDLSFNAIVSGMVESIEKAWTTRKPGRIFINSGRVEGANINRSPSSYLANPKKERDLYLHEGQDEDVDKTMVLLRIEDDSGKPLGSVNWFAVHPTSMNNTNKLISGDNKGYASQLFEKSVNPEDDRPGQGSFVAAFASTNLGDVSPNTAGAKCIDTGEECDFYTSKCANDNLFVKYCIAFGDGKDMEDSTRINAERQFKAAERIFNDKENAAQIKGPVGFAFQYVNMTNYNIGFVNNGHPACLRKTTCNAALGYSFAAGTTDGPGMFNFVQGDTRYKHPFWDLVRGFIKTPSPELIACQRPKPILLPVGETHFPYDWVASIVETQVLKVGNLYILGIPGELTTMAGRRLRRTVEELIKEKNGPDAPEPHVVVAGLSNVYTHYIATYEEYQKQRYEAASTLYGPCTLDAYLKQFSVLTESVLNGEELEIGKKPEDLLDRQLSLILPIVIDTAPFSKRFGQVLLEPVPEVNPGEFVATRFVGGHPRHSTMRGGTFFTVERDASEEQDGSEWKVVATDADWETKFRWSRPSLLSSESIIETSWNVPANAQPGFYRFRHFGYYKPDITPGLRTYKGTSAVFRVNGPGVQDRNHTEWTPKHKKAAKITSPTEFWRALVSAVKS